MQPWTRHARCVHEPAGLGPPGLQIVPLPTGYPARVLPCKSVACLCAITACSYVESCLLELCQMLMGRSCLTCCA